MIMTFPCGRLTFWRKIWNCIRVKLVVLDAIVTPSSANTPLVWASSDETDATVSGGCIQAISPGKAVITVSANGLSASCTVEVSKRVIPVESVSLDRTGAFAGG